MAAARRDLRRLEATRHVKQAHSRAEPFGFVAHVSFSRAERQRQRQRHLSSGESTFRSGGAAAAAADP